MPGVSRRTFIQGVAATIGTAAAAGAMSSMSKGKGPGEIKDARGPGVSPVKPEPIMIPAWYYKHFDADYTKSVPESGFGGWAKSDLEFSRTNTAIVVMHAWEAGTFESYPGWYRCAPFVSRANKIAAEVFPGLLGAVRKSGMKLFHVAGGSNGYWKKYPGYKYTLSVCKEEARKYEQAAADVYMQKLQQFKNDNAFVGAHNLKDVNAGFEKMDFPGPAKPLDNEPIAENGEQLFAVCKEHGINHLIYCGFAINWCLLLSPGGMAEMQRYGIMCSAIKQATTAVESKESAPNELAKELALWRVALGFGFVFDADDVVKSLKTSDRA